MKACPEREAALALLKKYGLSAENIVKVTKEFLGK